MFNALASIFWSLIRLIRFALAMLLFFYLIVIIGIVLLGIAAIQNGTQ